MEHVRKYLNSKYDRKLTEHWHIRYICHVVHLRVKDAVETIMGESEDVRSLLKSFRLSQINRDLFKEAQKHLNKPTITEVPNLDVETRWNSMFHMVSKSYQLRDVFESICNDDRASDAIRGKAISSERWEKLNTIIEFLKLPAEVTEMSSASNNSTISLQSKILQRLLKQCNDAMASTTVLPAVRNAAALLKRKLTKYKPNLMSEHNEIFASLDPRISRKEGDHTEIKETIRCFIEDAYDVEFNQENEKNKEKGPRYLLFESEDDSDQDSNADEIDRYFCATAQKDRSLTNFIEWWKREGQYKYPKMALLARDTLMIRASSVPAESTFSDSGHIVRADRTRLTDEHIRILVTLRSWNRFLNYC